MALEYILGELNDYDPRAKTIRLSDSVYSSNSLAAIGVAAHEAGHAIQHATGYAQLVWRNSFAPVAGFGSGFGPILAMVGLIFNSSFLLELGNHSVFGGSFVRAYNFAGGV